MVLKNESTTPINRKPIRPIERQKMRPWLLNLLMNENVPGLAWLSKRDRSFRISWRHAARQGWNPKKDADLFERWARHTGKFFEGDEPDPKKWKANFRCALNSLPDVKEAKELGMRRGQNAFKVYQFLDEKRVKSAQLSKQTTDAQPSTKKSERPQRTRIPSRRYRDSMESDDDMDYDSSMSTENSRGESESHDDTSCSGSDSETFSERPNVCPSSNQECADFPVFDKICDYNIELKPQQSIEDKRTTDEQLLLPSACSIIETTDDYESASTTSASSTLTDEEVIDMLAEMSSDDHQTMVYHPDLWGADIVPEIAMEQDVETTYVVLSSVNLGTEEYQVVSETDAVRTEQLQLDEVSETVYTSLTTGL